MNTITPEIITAMRALQLAVWRLDSIIREIPMPLDDEKVIAEVLQDSGMEAIKVANNAFETLCNFDIDYSQSEHETFRDAFAKLKVAALNPMREAA